MKQQLYILSCLLILFISLVYLNDYSARCGWNGSDKQYFKILQYTSETQNLEDTNDYDLGDWETLIQSAGLTVPDGIPVMGNIDLPVLFLHQVLSNPLLIDLPPPALYL